MTLEPPGRRRAGEPMIQERLPPNGRLPGEGRPRTGGRRRRTTRGRREAPTVPNASESEIVKVAEATLTYVAVDDERRPRPLPED